jgi:hypothetical protein
MPELNWRMTASWPKSLDTLYGGAEIMAKAVAEATDNKFQIQVFAAGEIVPGLQVLDAVQNGTVEMGHSAGTYYVGKDPTLAFDTTLPFGMNARQQEAWMNWGGGRELLAEVYKDYNTVSIPCGNTGAQMGGWFRKEIKTPEDMKGLKFRIAGIAGRSVQAGFGAAAGWRRHLRPWRRARSMPPSGRPLRRPEARLQQDRAVLLLRDGGRPQFRLHQSREVERAAEGLQSRDRGGVCEGTTMMPQNTTRRIKALRELMARHQADALPAVGARSLLQRGQRALRRNLGEEPEVQEGLRCVAALPQRGDPWFRVAELLDSFMARQSAAAEAVGTVFSSPARTPRGGGENGRTT